MKLRDRQVVFSDRAHAALDEHGNTVGVAPTGAGKTVLLSHIVGRRKPQHALILQHRDELVRQNRSTFELVAPGVSTGVYTAERKELGYGATFAMVQTLVRNLERMPPADIMAIDEAHHATADTYRRIIDKALALNPGVKILGVTATPNRGDKKGLRSVFSNCCDMISLRELIDARHLVPPRTFVIDIGVRDALNQVRRTISDFDMAAVEKIMDKSVHNERIVAEWKRLAGDRQTVIFCSTVGHADHVRAAFVEAGVKAALVDGEMSAADRIATLTAYDKGEIQVIVNVAVLTEGWDHQPTSCVILLRPSSYKSTMIQMIGRGLRKVDPERYPGVRKDDCIVIDFGTSLHMHGGIEQDVNLDQKGSKECPECHAIVPAQTGECPICGFEWPKDEAPYKLCKACGAQNHTSAKLCIECDEPFEKELAGDLGEFTLTEVSLFDASPYRWEPLFDGIVWVATAFETWAVVVSYMGRWHALGGIKGERMRRLSDTNEKLLALASADDFLREHGDTDAGSKSRQWLYSPPTDRQLALLQLTPDRAIGMTRYQAGCHLTWKFNERGVRAMLEMTQRMAA